MIERESDWACFKIKRIPDPFKRRIYLTRFIIVRTPWLHIYVHRIHFPDPDRHVHNHPWRAQCLILWGGYVEEVVTPAPVRSGLRNFLDDTTEFRAHARADVNTLADNEYHRIVDVLPGTWSLLLGGRRFRPWGFLVDGEHVDDHEYARLGLAGKRRAT